MGLDDGMPKPTKATLKKRAAVRSSTSYSTVANFVEEVCRDDIHAKRILSLTGAVFGVIHAAAIGVHAIGAAFAKEMGLQRKHAVKQIDRLMGNKKLDDHLLQALWTRRAVGEQKRIVVALDWTDFDRDDQTSLVLSLAGSGRHGRAVPLVWTTVKKSELKDQRNDFEDDLVIRFEAALPDGVEVTLLADRGFGDQKLYRLLDELGFEYVIRFRGVVLVTNAKGERHPASEWLAPSGQSRKLASVRVTADGTPIKAFVCAHHKGMKDAWFLASSRSDLSAAGTVALYGRRFTIEENFRDTKNGRFGLGLGHVRTSSCQRRDRFIFIAALAEALLTLLGQAAEETGLDRGHKTNTSPRRQTSLFGQGLYWYDAVRNLDDETVEMLMSAFGRLLLQDAVFVTLLGVED